MAIKQPSRSSIKIKGSFIIYGLGAAGPGVRAKSDYPQRGEIFRCFPKGATFFKGHEDPIVVHALAQGLY